MPRLLFEKTGDAIWISHLDLMRLFQRAFKRAGLPLKHTQGFNQRPSVSIALPLSVGMESRCELLDFDIDGESIALDEITCRLNRALISGVRVLDTYGGGRKIRELALLDCTLTLTYDSGVPQGAAETIEALLCSDRILTEKKGKSGISEQDIAPMIRSHRIQATDANTILLCARICCQNPSLNPMQIVAAIARYLPEMNPSFAKCRREMLLDENGNEFR